LTPSEKPPFEPLFPPGLNTVTTDELRSICVDAFPLSATRKAIFQNLLEVMQRLADNSIVGDLWVDGSFVTSKFNPRDVDIVLCVSFDLYDNCSAGQRAVFDWIESEVLHTDYRCDGYILMEWPVDHPFHSEGVVARNYWSNLFGHTREAHEKGIAIVRLTGATT
jgi:hypothetical protein